MPEKTKDPRKLAMAVVAETKSAAEPPETESYEFDDDNRLVSAPPQEPLSWANVGDRIQNAPAEWVRNSHPEWMQSQQYKDLNTATIDIMRERARNAALPIARWEEQHIPGMKVISKAMYNAGNASDQTDASGESVDHDPWAEKLRKAIARLKGK